MKAAAEGRRDVEATDAPGRRLSLSAACSIALLSAAVPDAAAQPSVISGITVIDAAAGAAVPNRWVVVDGRSITAVLPAADFSRSLGLIVSSPFTPARGSRGIASHLRLSLQ